MTGRFARLLPRASLCARLIKWTLATGLMACLFAGLTGQASAQINYPTKPVKIVVPFPPGGGADIVARLLAPFLQATLGQPFYIENRSGAAGRVGTGAVAQAEPDGYTLLVTTESSVVIAPHMGVTMSYDPLKDLAPISLLTRNTIMLVVNPDMPVRTLADYIKLARAEPGQILYASSGVGGPNHLAGELFKLKAQVEVVHVPFQGTGAALQAVIANQVGSMWGFTSGLLPFVKANSLRPIAVGSRNRSASLPDVPTVIESGIDDFEATSWIGMLAPAGIDRRVVSELSSAVRAALKAPDVVSNLVRDGSEIASSSTGEFQRVIEQDYAKYEKLSGLFRQSKQ